MENMKNCKTNSRNKDVFQKNMEELIAVSMATASRNGIPNVAPMVSVWIQDDDETIWICDNYMVKTLANLQENPRVVLYFWNPKTKRCIQIKGDASVQTSGADYETMKKRVRAKKETYPAKSLISITITEVYECTPGSVAGDKIA